MKESGVPSAGYHTVVTSVRLGSPATARCAGVGRDSSNQSKVREPGSDEPYADQDAPFDAVVNLAGASVAGGRWSPARSRRRTTRCR